MKAAKLSFGRFLESFQRGLIIWQVFFYFTQMKSWQHKQYLFPFSVNINHVVLFLRLSYSRVCAFNPSKIKGWSHKIFTLPFFILIPLAAERCEPGGERVPELRPAVPDRAALRLRGTVHHWQAGQALGSLLLHASCHRSVQVLLWVRSSL